MLLSLIPEISVVQLLTRMTATAFVVIAIATAVGRFGAVIGGALAGLPMVLGPGFFFLMLQASPDFVSEAAAYSLLSLCAAQVLLLAYIAAADRAGPLPALLTALGAWAAAAVLLQLFPPQPLAGLALFAVVTLAARKLGAAFVRPAQTSARADRFGLLLLRGLLAGLLVAFVTAGASKLGATGSGLLLGFPIGYTVLSITIHEQFGAETAAATLHSALLGTISLAGFCATLALAMPVLSPASAFLLALAVSVAITVGLVLRSRFGPAPIS